MPPRIPGQPESMIGRYRERLNEEMAQHGETDRSLAEKLKEAGFPVPYSSINKTRNGTRQPTLDECYAVARALGYPDLEGFLDGPASVAISRAVARLQYSMDVVGLRLRSEVTEALRDLHHAVNDPAAAGAADRRNPQWRQEFRDGLQFDLRCIVRDQLVLWGETTKRLAEVFDGLPEPPDPAAAGRDLAAIDAETAAADAAYHERQAARQDARGETGKARRSRARAAQSKGGNDAQA